MKLTFLEGGGLRKNSFHGGGIMNIFLNLHKIQKKKNKAEVKLGRLKKMHLKCKHGIKFGCMH